MAGEEKAQKNVSLGWKWVWPRMVLENKAEETIPQPRHGVTAQIDRTWKGVHWSAHTTAPSGYQTTCTKGCTG